ncbi:MAG: glutamate 5-kinase [Nitrospinales bacterium]
MRKKIIKNLKRVVIKIGSSVISHDEQERSVLVRGLNPDTIKKLAARIRKMVDNGYEVVLVSSGAIMAGRERLNFNHSHLSIPEKQACAAIGQSFLMRTYEKQFEKHDIQVAQILLGHDDLENRKRYLNAKNTIDTLLAQKVVPVINENDTVSVDEIKIGDNDNLSATVACLVDAQLLIILSDVDGLYTRDPSKPVRKSDSPPQLISLVEHVTAELEKTAGKSSNRLTVGGMYTKVLAAKKTMSFGIPTFVVNGMDLKILDRIFAGDPVGTLFWSGKEKIKNRKHWIAHTLKPMGKIIIDAGAKKAITERGKSLLPAGILLVEGRFGFGNSVRILDENGEEFTRGLVNYGHQDLQEIKGKKSSEVKNLVGGNFFEEVIHRDDLVLI